MFISGISVENYRLFSTNPPFMISGFNVPDGDTEGSGINVFVGENGCGKTTILDALSLPLLEYKSDGFTLEDMNDPRKSVSIFVFADKNFSVQSTMPNVSFEAKGFEFKAGFRTRGTRAYLSSTVVTDQLFIQVTPNKPKEGSPDLRTTVNNPFSGKRFNENDILFLDKNRYYQTKTGNFNQTRFDRLMEDFDYQYIKGSENIADINDMFSLEVKKVPKVPVENSFLNEAITEFRAMTGISVKLALVENYHPFRNAVFVQKKGDNQQIKIGALGSGYEMLFSLLYSYNMARQSGKQLIVLIDEPELHLHPALQEQLIAVLLRISKDSQIFMSTHSALFIKQLAKNDRVKIMILNKENTSQPLEARQLPYVSSNEINYLAFGLVTEEYHNELYGFITAEGEFDNFKKGKSQIPYIQPNSKKSTAETRHITLTEYVRHQIHHPENTHNERFTDAQLLESINLMRNFIRDLAVVQ